MSERFNPPPFWRQYLPADFRPATDWIPETAWGAPPAGWAMWVDTETGFPTAPPEEYRNNPYMFMSVMPGLPVPPLPTEAMPVNALSAAKAPAHFSPPAKMASTGRSRAGKKPLSKGLKITFVVLGIIVFGSIVGSCAGGGGETPAPAAIPSAVATEEPASATPAQASPTPSTAVNTKAEAEASAEAQASAEAKEKAEASAEAKEKAEASAEAKASAEAEAEAAAEAEAEAGTLSQQNALRSAENYLDFAAFSRTGLIKQLEFEEYSTKDATWAVDRVTVDWNEQAAKSAANYLDFTAFSRSGLIDQLIFEGFTQKQAKYGVAQTGL